MSRILTTFVIATAALGVVVAIVRGQDRAETAPRERSVLKRRDAGSDDKQPVSSRRSDVYSAPLAERLKAIRDDVASEPRGESADGGEPAGLGEPAPLQAQPRSRYADRVDEPQATPRPIEVVRPGELREPSASAPLLPVTEPGAAGNYAPVVTPDELEDQQSSRRVFQESGVGSSDVGSADVGSADVGSSDRIRPKLPDSVAPRTRPATRRGSVTLSGVSPTLHVEIIGPDAIDIGREGTYEVTIINQGASDARDVEVHLTVPKFVEATESAGSAGALQRSTTTLEQTQWIWRVGDLDIGQQQRLQLKLVARVKQPFQLAAEWTARAASATASIDVRQAQLRIVVDGPTDVMYGDTVPYVIRLSNPGTGDAEEATISITTGSEPAQSRPIGTIAAGDSREIRFELTAREAGSMQITAGATAIGGLETEVVHRIHIRRAKLNLAVTGPKYKFAGTPTTYKVVVSNSGDAPAQDVRAILQLPAGGKYLAGIDGAETNGGQLSWLISDVEVGGQRTFQFQIEHGLAGENVLQTLVQAAGDLRAIERFTTEVEALADLKLVVQDPKGPRAVNEEVIYEIRVLNQGTKAAEGVRVIAQFSEGIEPVRAEGAPAEVVPGQVLFQRQGQIAPGETLVLKVAARAEKDGNHKFRAVVEGTEPETKLIAEEMTRFFEAGVLQGR